VHVHLRMHVHAKPKGDTAMNDEDARFLADAPRLFGIVADPEDDDHPQIVAWGHELPDQAVVSWRLGNGEAEIAVFSSAEEAVATAQLLYTARLIWVTAAVEPVH